MTIDVRDKIGAGVDKSQFRLESTFKDANELPRKIVLTYYDTSLNGAPGVVESFTERRGGRVLNISSPVSMTRNEAKTVADRIMLKAWAERTTYRLSLPIEFCVYDPGDVLELQVEDAKIIKIRITETQFDPRGVVHIQAVQHDPTVYSYNSFISNNDPVTENNPPADTIEFYLVETPPIDFEDYAPPACYLCAVQTENFKGGTVYISFEANSGYTPISELTNGTFVGTTVGGYPAGNSAIRNMTRRLIVQPKTGCTKTLTSKTLGEVTEGGNLLYINGEIIKFQNATLSDDGYYVLDTIWRGCRGTESKASNTIPSGSNVFLLDFALPLYSTKIGSTMYVKVPVEEKGETVSTVPSKSITLSGLPFQAWNVVRIKKEPSGANSFKIRAAHRSRFSRDWNGYNEIPHDSDFQKFVVTFDGVNNEATTNEQIIDWGSNTSGSVDLFVATQRLYEGQKRTVNINKGIIERFKD